MQLFVSCDRKLKTKNMELKEKLLSSFLAFENQVDVDAYVHDLRSEAIKSFEDKGFPNKKDEAC